MEKNKTSRKFLATALVAIMVISILVAFASSTELTQLTDTTRSTKTVEVRQGTVDVDKSVNVDKSVKNVTVKQGTKDVDKSYNAPVRVEQGTNVDVDKSVKNVTVKQGTKDVDKSYNAPVRVEQGTKDVNKSNKTAKSPGCENSVIYNTYISNGEDVDGDGCLESFDLEIDADTPGEFYCDVNVYIEASTGESWWTTCWTIYYGATSDNAFIHFDASEFATTTECEEVTLTVYLYTCDGEYTGSSDTVSVLLEGQEGCENSVIYNTYISNGEDVDGDGCLESFDLEIDADTPGEFYCDVNVYIEASTGESWWTTCWTIYYGATSDNAFIHFDAPEFATTTECEEVTLTVYLYTCDGEYTGSSDTVSVLLECDECPDGQTDYWAVIVGVADYEGTVYDLEYTDDDAIDLYNTLLLSDDYWQADHIMLLLDSEADRVGILTAFDWLDSNEDPDDVVLFFFSGHGTYKEDDDGDELDGWDEFICPCDFNDIRDDELDAELDRLGSTSIAVIIDSCFAGGMTKAPDRSVKTLPKQKVELTDGFVNDLLAQNGRKDMGDSGRVVLMACDDDEVSWETDVLENGVFSYYVVEGLEGLADAEGDGDSICSAEETFAYASPRVVAYGSPTTQHPQLYDEYPGELPITRPISPELSYSPESHDFGDMCEGETDSTTFELWNSGTGTLTYSLSESSDWLEVNPTGGSSTEEHDTITVDIDTTGLSEGSHTCDITINSNDGSGTFTVMVSVVPCPELSYSPASHDYGDKCEGVTDNTTFEIWNSGTGTLTYSLSESCGWVEVNPTSGSSTSEHDTITVDIDTTGLAEGSHTCDISISSNGGSGTFTVTVNVVPCEEPVLSYLPTSHDFGDMCEGVTDSTTFEIWNSGTDTLAYSLSESCGWVDVHPTSGSSTGEHDTITVDIDTTGLAEGSHTCDISISSNGGSGTFTVTVNVVPCEEPVLSYLPTSHDFGDMCEGVTDSTTFEIWNSGTDTLAYSLSESCGWVDVHPTSGSSTGEHDTITVDIDTTELSEGSHTCDISINSNDGTGTFTVTVNVVPVAETVVSIEDASAPQEATVTVPINIAGVENMCGANIWLNYNKDVVIVDSVSDGDLVPLTYNIDNPAGITKMNWDTTSGMTGDFVFAYVTLKAVGNPGDTCLLDLDVKELYDCDLVESPRTRLCYRVAACMSMYSHQSSQCNFLQVPDPRVHDHVQPPHNQHIALCYDMPELSQCPCCVWYK